MKPSLTLVAALAVTLAGPAMAQQASAPAAPAPAAPTPAAPAPVPVPADPAATPAPAAAAPRTITARELMTREERADFRRELRRATPEQRATLWTQKRAELSQRATARGLVLAEPGPHRGGPGERGEGGRGEGGTALGRMMGWGPRAP